MNTLSYKVFNNLRVWKYVFFIVWMECMLKIGGIMCERKKKMLGVSFRIPEEYLEQIDTVAVALGRSRGDILRRAVRFYLEKCAEVEIALENLKEEKIYYDKNKALEYIRKLLKGGLDESRMQHELLGGTGAISKKG